MQLCGSLSILWHCLSLGLEWKLTFSSSVIHTVHGVLKARILKWWAIPSPVEHILSNLSTMTRPSWVAPRAWLSFIELDKAVVLVWLDWLVFCECGFSVSALWCPLATPTVLLGFLLPWPWGMSSRLLQQSSAAAPYLGRGVSPPRRPSWPSTWDSSSRPSCAGAAMAPWTWSWPSWPPPLASVVGWLLPATALGLGLRGQPLKIQIAWGKNHILILFKLTS